MAKDNEYLKRFVIESNAIEGITGSPKRGVVEAHENLLGCECPSVSDVSHFALAMESHAHIRLRPGMDVRVGHYIAPKGGPEIVADLDSILQDISLGKGSPLELHVRFEKLHPFMDGNGRTGRALWLWQSIWFGSYNPKLGFLHQWYYSTLD